ncbi:MAG TPA: hypothetical protein VMW02_01130 [Thermoplasmata archaeon]|nr:hypothetical protein [Thermoplasmata archaeon]
MAGGVKKWFMLQVWRLQQVAAILTLALLSLNLALQMYNFMDWREGVFSSPYYAVPILLLLITLVIWGFAIFWDLRMKMWREQMAVAMERNPYAKEKLYAKEIANYAFMWLPILDNLGKTDPEAKAHADSLRTWVDKALKDDAAAMMEWKELLEYIGKYPDRVGDLGKK